jgi:mannose-6-phosphate isomerase-like protein (cupin superfamily)
MLQTLAFAAVLLQASGAAPATAPVVTAAQAADTLKASIEKNTVDTLMKGVPVEGGQTSVAMLYRTKAETSALIHDHATEVYYILEGSGTLTTGGALEDATVSDLTRLGAGMSHSGKHVGGTDRKIAPHDIIIVPGGMPHRFSQLDGPIKYLVYRFDPSQKH